MLNGEVLKKCHFCMQHLCEYCVFQLDFNGTKVSACSHCWQDNQVQAATIGKIEFEKLSKTEEEMRQELGELGLEISLSKAIDYVGVIGLYKDYVLSNYPTLRVKRTSVNGPKYSPSELGLNKKCISIINLKEGGSFIGGTRINNSTLPKVVQLFAEVVTFGSKKNFDYGDKIFEALPTIILQFCSDARVRNGYRMTERTLRHSMDFRNKGIAGNLFYSTSVTFSVKSVISVC